MVTSNLIGQILSVYFYSETGYGPLFLLQKQKLFLDLPFTDVPLASVAHIYLHMVDQFHIEVTGSQSESCVVRVWIWTWNFGWAVAYVSVVHYEAHFCVVFEVRH